MSPAAPTLELAQLLLAFALAAGLSLYACPLAVRAGRHLGLVAHPDGRQRLQPEPISYLGGLAVYASFLLAYSLVFSFDERILALLLAASVVAVVGLMDDFGELTPKAKLFGQGVATFVLIKGGIHLQWGMLPLWANIAVTALWIVAIMNAFNFLDILDGLAGGSALITTAFLLVAALLGGDSFIATFTVVLLGSLLGFLRHNLPPARLYLGDTGALLLGLLVAALAIVPSYTARNPLALLTPLLILFLPCFEMTFTTATRIGRGLHPFHGSPDHPALRLRRNGWPVLRVLLCSYALQLVTGGLALWNLWLTPRSSAGLLGVVATGSLALAAWLWTKSPEGGEELP